MNKWSVFILLTSVIMLWLVRIAWLATANVLEREPSWTISISSSPMMVVITGIVSFAAAAIGIISLWKPKLTKKCFFLGSIICALVLTDAVFSAVVFGAPSIPATGIFGIVAVFYTFSAYKFIGGKIDDKTSVALFMISVVLIVFNFVDVLVTSTWLLKGITDGANIALNLDIVVAYIWAAVAIVAGVIGIITFRKPKSAKICFVSGIVICIASLLVAIITTISIGFILTGWYLFWFVLSVLYTLAAYKIKRNNSMQNCLVMPEEEN